jgi:hypothetical protein
MLFWKEKSKKGTQKPVSTPNEPAPTAPPASTDHWRGWSPSAQPPIGQVNSRDNEQPPKLQGIILQPGGSVVGHLSIASVRAGRKVKVDVPLTSTQTASAKLRVLLLCNSAAGGAKEIFKSFIKLGPNTQVIGVGGTFASPHASLRIEIKNVGQSTAEFTAAPPRVFVN